MEDSQQEQQEQHGQAWQLPGDAQWVYGPDGQAVAQAVAAGVEQQRSVGEGRVSTAKPLTKAARCDFPLWLLPHSRPHDYPPSPAHPLCFC
jgi:hypothetical protein